MPRKNNLKGASVDAHTQMLEKIMLEIAQAGQRENKRYYISGGFALDVAQQGMTREHEDIDLVVDELDAEWWKAWFTHQGFTLAKDDYMQYFPSAFAVLNKEKELVAEVYPMLFRSDNSLVPTHTPDHPGREWWHGKTWDTLQTIVYKDVPIVIENPKSVIKQKLDHVRHHREPLLPKHQHDLERFGYLDEYKKLIKEQNIDEQESGLS